MPGGLIQLATYGAHDFYLTNQPQISYFKSVYRRYTNFAIKFHRFSIQFSSCFFGLFLIMSWFKSRCSSFHFRLRAPAIDVDRYWSSVMLK